MRKFIGTSVFLLFILLVNAQTDSAKSHKLDIVTPDEINWQTGPPTLPPGAKFYVIEGDLKKEGLIIMRLLLPAGYEIPAHYHPGAERAIILSGTFNMGTGDKLNKQACTKMPAGSMAIMPAGGIPHYGWSSDETIVQVHMDGPLEITYVNPDDDPR
jgi:quercetin dioxygenase-like cupin family protein